MDPRHNYRAYAAGYAGLFLQESGLSAEQMVAYAVGQVDGHTEGQPLKSMTQVIDQLEKLFNKE